MKILLDMNLSPDWIPVLHAGGHEAIHWQEIGKANAKDREILSWAKEKGFVVFTHDLDFSALLAASKAQFPSVIQLRGEDILPTTDEKEMLLALQCYREELNSGALMTIDKKRKRIRLLPIRK